MTNKTVSSIKSRLQAISKEEYIESHSSQEPEVLQEIRRQAHESLVHPRMLSGQIQGLLLQMFVRMIEPMSVLELGTYSGYATIAMAKAIPSGGKVTTIELNEELEPMIRKAFEQAGVSNTVELIMGDAMEVLPSLPIEEVDMVYLDADKKQYPEYFRILISRLKSGAFILADNTLWGDKVYDYSFHDPQTKAIRHFNQLVAEEKRVEKLILPIRDGLTIMYVK